MDTVEVHSKDFVIKWINVPGDSIVEFQVRPLKKSINFSFYKKNGDESSVSSLSRLQENNGSLCLSTTTNGSSSVNASTDLLVPPSLPTEAGAGASSSRLRSDSVNSVQRVPPPYRRASRSSVTVSSQLSLSNLVLIKDYFKLVADEFVHGKLEVGPGTYGFMFDNTFSKTTAKKVFFDCSVIPKSVPTPAPSSSSNSVLFSVDLSATKSHTSLGAFRPKDSDVLQSMLLKKRRRKKLQGFVKRYFVLNFTTGNLSYYKPNDNKLRGQMPIKLAIVSANSSTNEIIVDSGMEVWYLKALDKNDFKIWVNAFNEVKDEEKDDISNQKSGTRVPEAEIRSLLVKISNKLSELKTTVGVSSTEQIQQQLFDTHGELLDVLKYFEDDKSASGSGSGLGDGISIFSLGEFYDAQEQFYSSVVLLNEDEEETQEQPTTSSNGLKDIKEEDEPVVSDDDGDSSSECDSESDVAEETVPEPTIAYKEDDCDYTLFPLPHLTVVREIDIPKCTHTPPSILSFVRKNVGKDLASIAMPVTFNEPLTILQKFAELVEYCDVITNALLADFPPDSGEKILRIATFAVSYLSSMRVKERNVRKPFNPLLGETFELVREDFGIRLVAEKVSHRPPVFAYHVEHESWLLTFSPSPEQKFWGKNFEVTTKGTCKLTDKVTGEVYTWNQARTLIKNIIAGEKYSEPTDSMTIKSSSGLKAVVEFAKAGMFSGRSEDLTINAFNSSKEKLNYSVSGKWTEKLILKTTTTEKVIWEVGKLLPEASKRYGLTEFAASLNLVTPLEANSLPPTDSRLRPDMKVYISGDIEKAEELKIKLEEDQRTRRKEYESSNEEHVPRFFKHVGGGSPDTGEWVYKTGENSYWNRRKNNEWSDLVKMW